MSSLHASRFEPHCARMIAGAQPLACAIAQTICEALHQPSHALDPQQERQLAATVARAIGHRQPAFEHAFVDAIRAAAEADLASTSAHVSTPSPEPLSIDSLTLIDTEQAEADIEVARTVQLIELNAEWEIRELVALTSAAKGEQEISHDHNPFGPYAYAHALSAAVRALALPHEAAQVALRLGGRALGKRLQRIYHEASRALKAEGVQPLAYRAVTHPRPAQAPAPDLSQPGALKQVLQQLPEPATLPRPAVAAAVEEVLARNILAQAPAPAPLPEDTTVKPTPEELRALRGLTRLIDAMVQEAGKLPAVQPLVQQLQTSIIRLALRDPRLIGSETHPAWRLVNEVVAYASGFEQPNATALKAFLTAVQPHITRLAEARTPDTTQYAATLDDVRTLIQRQSTEVTQPHQADLQGLEAGTHRQPLKPLLQAQIRQQLADQPVPPFIAQFLCDRWTDVLCRTMTGPHANEQAAQDALDVVDALIGSLQPPTTVAEQTQLRRQLPQIVSRLRQGMALIAMPDREQIQLLNALMPLHSKHLRDAPRPREDSSPEAIVQRLREEQTQDHPADDEARPRDTGLGALATVPMGLPDAEGAGTDPWLDALAVGTWCKLVIDGQWSTARLVWSSDNRQFFMFSGARDGSLHTLTRGALTRLRREGLAAQFEDRSLVQRAVDSLLQDLPDA